MRSACGSCHVGFWARMQFFSSYNLCDSAMSRISSVLLISLLAHAARSAPLRLM